MTLGLRTAPFTYKSANPIQPLGSRDSGGYRLFWAGNYGLFPILNDIRNQPMNVPLRKGNSGLAQRGVECAGDRFE